MEGSHWQVIKDANAIAGIEVLKDKCVKDYLNAQLLGKLIY